MIEGGYEGHSLNYENPGKDLRLGTRGHRGKGNLPNEAVRRIAETVGSR